MGLLGRVQQLYHLEPTFYINEGALYTNEGVPRQRGKAELPSHSRSTMGQAQLTSPLVESLVGGPRWQLWVSQP